MIVDSIDKPAFPVPEALGRALEYLRGLGTDMPEGEYEIDGRAMFARVARYDTIPVEKGRYEAHRRYEDVQALLEGSEDIVWAPLGSMPLSDYDPEADVSFYSASSAEGSNVRMTPGVFAFFMPGDAHMPMLHTGGKPSRVAKVVVKIDVGLLDSRARQDV